MKDPATHSMYFLAVLCPASFAEKVQKHKLWMRDRFGCTVALKSAAHITLIPPFWMDEAKEDELIETLQQFSSNDVPEIQLKDFSHFGDRVLFIHANDNEQLTALKNNTEEHFLQQFPGVIKKDERPFNPHVTIANRDVSPSTFLKAWGHFSKEQFESSFVADTVSVLKLISGRWNVIADKKI